nr:surface antigen 2 [Toxoplasma gondii]
MCFSKTTSLAWLAHTGLFLVFQLALASTTETPAPIESSAGATKSVDAPSRGSVVFQCGDKQTISPCAEGDVIYGKECTDSRKLTTVLPGAAAGRNNDGCSAPSPKDCKLIVPVPGADGRVTSGFDPVSLTGKVLAPGVAGLLITFV